MMSLLPLFLVVGLSFKIHLHQLIHVHDKMTTCSRVLWGPEAAPARVYTQPLKRPL